MGGMALSVRAARSGRASLFALCGTCFGAEGVLRRAQPPFRSREEFPRRDAGAGAAGQRREIFLAPAISAARPRQRRAVPRRRQRRISHGVVHRESALRADRQSRPIVASTPRDPRARPHHARRLPSPDAMPWNERTEGGRVVTPTSAPGSLLVIVPAYNEEAAIASVVREIQESIPGVPVLVIDDCSVDSTVQKAQAAGAEVLPAPHHLGLGGCVQAGYKLAYELGYEYVIRVDGDGQHDAHDIPRIFERLKQSGKEMVIGSRFVEESGQRTGLVRSLGIRFFRLVLRPILGTTVYDPTSGFVGVNRRALDVFSRSFPLEYPEIEALVVLQRRQFSFEEVPCKFRPRTTGRTSITPVKSLYYIVHVLLGVFVNVLKFERRLHRK